MNEQVNELIAKAFDKAIPYTWDSLDYIEVEKLLKTFAELLISEGTYIAREEGNESNTDGLH